MNDLQRMNIEEWIGALRGGGYKHTAGIMHKPETGEHCALGVLCDIHGLEWIDEKTAREREQRAAGYHVGYEFPYGTIYAGVPHCDWTEEVVGLDSDQIQQVYLVNDTRGFDAAADLLKHYMNE